ncbi:FAD-dependent monooxygenase [Bacillus sp. ISL-35]|uniref:FAD-dependent oxidoreductase n=1 Tax=Bacillus sp. ISL-35 TaxID=2819122 RepID=UPI001BEA75D8|nr:FAD-dependent monooxygenase [Bacillus sp. ISL-35]MBT2680948.1 FAD-dependent monooxygenase [Bacillus sp. ISL-35]MBT2705265.1 FAD-dependent monooxygenase [Chryseobacterium sp. ISL-80]
MYSKKEAANRAVVVGNGMAGKLAARVLSEFFDEVIVIEKDKNQKDAFARKGAPQGKQGHVLLKSGEEILEELFPGLLKELSQKGATLSDFAGDLTWSHHGSHKVRFESKVSISQQSRPLLEWSIQKRLETLPNIVFRYSCKVQNLLYRNNEVDRVVIEEQNGNVTEISADLIIDASGAAALHTKWLKDSGFRMPAKTEIKVDLFYASMVYRKLSSKTRDWHSLLSYPAPPLLNRGGTISPLEENHMLVTLIGYGEKNVPTDRDSFLQYSKTLDEPDFFEAIKAGLLRSETVQVYRFPSMRRFHFERQNNAPSGLLVIGDAFCRVDPVFAQGMSLAAMEAKALRTLLSKGLSKKDLTKKFHRKVSRIVDMPWLIALTEDFRFSTTRGYKPAGLPFLQWFVKKVSLACSHDEKVYAQFIRVLHLKSHPVSLAKPSLLARIFRPTIVKPRR